MFDLNVWQEIFSTIRKNKLRTCLTGFSVSWGIFMLILLLGAGNGLKNGMMSNFSSESTNSMIIWSGRTSVPYAGYQKGRQIRFDDDDIELVAKHMPNVGVYSPTIWIYDSVVYGNNAMSYNVVGVYPSYDEINGMKIIQGSGRYINDMDIDGRRKIVVIGKTVRDDMFRGVNPIGKDIRIGKIVYKVVGVYETKNTWDNNEVHIPFSTGKLIYSNIYYGQIVFTLDGLKTLEDNRQYETLVRQKFATLHDFDPNDEQGVEIWNKLEGYLQAMGIFNGITIFVWIIGLGTLIGGVVGVGNIMLITVKERTKEFGIRKSLGATPGSIIKLIIMESVVITAVFGYIGMFLGIVVTELVSKAMESSDGNGANKIFMAPTVDLNVAIMATCVIVIAGVIAGYIPARKAVKISPIEALKYE